MTFCLLTSIQFSWLFLGWSPSCPRLWAKTWGAFLSSCLVFDYHFPQVTAARNFNAVFATTSQTPFPVPCLPHLTAWSWHLLFPRHWIPLFHSDFLQGSCLTSTRGAAWFTITCKSSLNPYLNLNSSKHLPCFFCLVLWLQLFPHLLPGLCPFHPKTFYDLPLSPHI